MLQCVAVCCGVLRCVAVYRSVLQCDAVCYSVLQCVAVCSCVLQCVAVCGSDKKEVWQVLPLCSLCVQWYASLSLSRSFSLFLSLPVSSSLSFLCLSFSLTHLLHHSLPPTPLTHTALTDRFKRRDGIGNPRARARARAHALSFSHPYTHMLSLFLFLILPLPLSLSLPAHAHGISRRDGGGNLCAPFPWSSQSDANWRREGGGGYFCRSIVAV